MTCFRIIQCLIASSLLLATTGMASSCAPHRKALSTHVASEKFKFLQDGQINRQEIIDRLGDPSSSYENGRIIVYTWFGEKPQIYSIVLVFDEDNVLERHSVVRKR